MPPSAAEEDHPDSAWNRAAERSPQGDPFCCRTEWQLSLQETFLRRRRLHLRASDSSFLALAERHYPDLGTTLEPLDSLWMFGSALLGPDALDLLDELLAERADRGAPTTTLLGGLMAEGESGPRIVRRFGKRFAIYRLKPVVVCRASLDAGIDGFLERRSALFRKRLRQATRRAATRGIHFERIVARTPAEADAAFDRMLVVERSSWKGKARRGMEQPASSAFYRAMARRLTASGNGRVVFARADECDVGFIFGGIAGPVYRGQQFSYLESWAEASIGNLLQQEQIRWLAEDPAILHYDMGPLMDYKPHWAEEQIPLDALLLRPRS